MNEFLNSGVCFKSRRIFLIGSVEEDNVGRVIRALYAMASMSEEEPVTVFVSSWGGSLDDAMGLADVMRLMSYPVHTVAIGKCMSAAPLIIAAGDSRYSMPNVSWMLHSVSQDVGEGTPDYLSGMATAGRLIVRRYAELLGSWTNMDSKHWRRIFRMNSDKFFDAEQARDWGIVDNVFYEED